MALVYLHSRKVLHRDVKAENIRMTLPTKKWAANLSRCKIKLIDFGLSCMMSETAEEVGWIGTPGYVAPEIIDREPHSPAMDVYSAGVVLFILLTGTRLANTCEMIWWHSLMQYSYTLIGSVPVCIPHHIAISRLRYFLG